MRKQIAMTAATDHFSEQVQIAEFRDEREIQTIAQGGNIKLEGQTGGCATTSVIRAAKPIRKPAARITNTAGPSPESAERRSKPHEQV